MAKPIGYYTNYTPGDGGLLGEMEEAWGSSFEKLKDSERFWLIALVAYEKCAGKGFGEDEGISEEVEEAANRIPKELPDCDVLGLLEALVHQLRYH